MPEAFTVLAGNGFSEFRQHGDGSIEVYNSEEDPDTGEEVGTVGFMTEDELAEIGEALRDVFEGDAESREAPELDEMVFGVQETIIGPRLIFVAKDEDGEPDRDVGAAFGDPETVIGAADSL